MEFLKGTSRKLHINFHTSSFLGSAPSPMCLQSVIMESKRTLRFLRGVLVVLDMVDATIQNHTHTIAVNIYRSS